MLTVQLKIGLRDGVGIKSAVGTARSETFGTARVNNAAVDHDLRHVDILRLQLARHALD